MTASPGTVRIDPAQIRQYGPAEGVTFCLVTNPAYAEAFRIETKAPYKAVMVVLTDDAESTHDSLISTLPEPAHVLVISPDKFFESPPPEVVGKDRKLLAMACNSTPTDLDSIRHFLGVIEGTDPDEQDRFAERFFGLVQEADVLRIENAVVGTELIFEHFDPGVDHVWNQQGGAVGWGEQQIVPSGEISVLPIEIRSFGEDLHLTLNGEIAINGIPILHNGSPSFSRVDQKRLHHKLSSFTNQAIVATVKDGYVTDLRPHAGNGCLEALGTLEALMEVDSRYRIVWEIGFAHNSSLPLLAGNHAMNEVYGGRNGCLHWGLGLTPFTQYHLDIISPGTQVLTDSGEIVLGEVAQRLGKEV